DVCSSDLVRLATDVPAGDVGGRLHLQGGVADAVAGLHDLLRPVENGVGLAVLGDHQVGGRHLHVRRQRPHVEVVDVDHAGDALQVGPQTLQVDVGRRRLHEDAEAAGGEAPATGKDEDADGDGHDQVGVRPAGGGHHGRGGDDARRAPQ